MQDKWYSASWSIRTKLLLLLLLIFLPGTLIVFTSEFNEHFLDTLIGTSDIDFLHEAKHQILKDLGFCGVLSALVTSVAWILAYFTLVKPIGLLAIAAQRFGKGDLTSRTGLAHTRDEFGQLAKSFDEMASLVELRSIERKQAEEDLQKTRNELEVQVATRTAELQRANQALKMEIADRKQVEDRLRESEEIFSSFMEHSPIYVFFKDENVRPIRLSRNYEQMVGLPVEQMIGKTMDELFPFELARSMIEDDLKILREGKRIEIVEELNGRIYTTIKFPIRTGGSPSLLAGFTMDVTDQVRMQEILRESEQKYRTLFETASDAIFLIEGDTCIDCNLRAVTMFGCKDKSDIIGRTQTDFSPSRQSDGRKSKEKMAQFISASLGMEPQEFYWQYQRNEGKLIDAVVSLNSFTVNGKSYIQAITRDVTEQRALESRLRQATKMEAMGTLAGGIAHEFNNILGIILGNTELALLDVSEWNTAREHLESVQSAVLRARDIVRQLLSFSRKTDIKCLPIDIGSITRESLKLLRASIPANIEIRESIDRDLSPIIADATQIQQILINLCTNAAHAMEEDGGLMEVRIDNVELHEKKSTLFDSLEPGRFVHLSVSDTGDGIAPELVSRIFDPFFTTREVGKGTGMGLALVHGIVKSHSGGIRVESATGEGTTIHVYFPAHEGEIETGPTIEKVLPSGTERILLVDDEDAIIATSRKMLQALGYSVEARTGGLEALELFREDPSKFDLVITDMMMPKMTGEVLAQRILAIRPDIPIIICTGFTERMNGDQASEWGIRDSLHKPLTMKDLSLTVRRVLDKIVSPDRAGI